MVTTEVMRETYDFRTLASSGCATFVVEKPQRRWQTYGVLKEAQIIAALRDLSDAKKTTQADIGRILGISASNANKLFNAAGKTGKTRSLGYDEALELIAAFDLDPATDTTPSQPMTLPIARLAVQYVAQQLGVRIDPDDERVEDLAQDIQAYSELAASSQAGDNLDEARGWLRGRGSRRSTRS